MKVTLVTALYDINRDKKGDGRTFDEYLFGLQDIKLTLDGHLC